MEEVTSRVQIRVAHRRSWIAVETVGVCAVGTEVGTARRGAHQDVPRATGGSRTPEAHQLLALSAVRLRGPTD